MTGQKAKILLKKQHVVSSEGAGITCEGHFSQQVLDLWRDAKFVQIQAKTNRTR